MKHVKKLSDLISIFIAVGFGAFVLLGIAYSFNLFGLSFKAVLIIVLIFSVPVLLPLISFIVNLLLRQVKPRQLTVEQVLYRQNTYDLYLQTRNYFRFALQNKMLTRQDILEFKSMLNKALKGSQRQYQGQKWENDVHEIYTKLKSHHISESNMTALRDYIMPYAIAATTSINSQTEPQPHYKHLRVVK